VAIGFQASKDGLNQQLGSLAASAAHLFDQANVLITWAAQNNDAALTPLGFSAGEVTSFRTYVADLTNWRDTTYGQRAQTPATNFMFNIAQARAYV
jgi:hypothetical protein